MSKLKWLLLIIVIIFVAYLIISKVNPDWGMGIDNLVGPQVTGFFVGIKTAVESNPTWQAYDIYFSGAFFALITFLLMWQGHNAYNKIRGAAVQSAAQEAGYKFQTAPTAAPVAIPATQTPVAQPVPVEQKKEGT